MQPAIQPTMFTSERKQNEMLRKSTPSYKNQKFRNSSEIARCGQLLSERGHNFLYPEKKIRPGFLLLIP